MTTPGSYRFVLYFLYLSVRILIRELYWNREIYETALSNVGQYDAFFQTVQCVALSVLRSSLWVFFPPIWLSFSLSLSHSGISPDFYRVVDDKFLHVSSYARPSLLVRTCICVHQANTFLIPTRFLLFLVSQSLFQSSFMHPEPERIQGSMGLCTRPSSV